MPSNVTSLDDHPNEEQWQDDPSMLRCRKEAFIILGAWLTCFFWTIIYCYLNGYLHHDPLPASQSFGPDIGAIVGPLESFNRDPKTLEFPLGLGIPDWVFWGIAVPWCLCVAFSILFCLFVFKEEKLGDESETDDE